MTRLLAVFLACGASAAAEEHAVDAASLPFEFAFDAPETGYVWLALAEAPQGFTPWLEIVQPEGSQVAKEALQARVPKGRVALRLLDRWNAKLAGRIRFDVRFAAEKDPSEPNDVYGRARPVKVNDPFELTVMPKGDEDWVVFDPGEPGYLYAQFEQAPEGSEMSCIFHRDETTALGTNWIRVDGAGEIRACIRDRWGNVGTVNPMRVTLGFVPEGDAFEPNDTPNEAVTILPELTYTLYLAPAKDIDWFRVAVHGEGHLVPEVLAGPKIETAWRLGPADGSIEAAPGAAFRVAEGTYLLGVASRLGDGSWEPFTFRVRFVPTELDQLEPNDAAPAPIRLGQEYRVALVGPGDIDQMTFEVPARGSIWMTYGARPPVHVALTLRVGDGEPQPFDVGQVVPAGRCTITMGSSWGQWSIRPFTMTVHHLPDPDPHEPNDGKETATPLRLGQAENVILFGEQDQDWFRFEVPAEGMLYVLLSGLNPRVGEAQFPKIELHDAESSTVYVLLDHQTFVRHVHVAKGTWYVRALGAHPLFAFTLTADMASGDPTRLGSIPANGIVFSFIGLNVDEGTSNSLTILANRTGATFRNAASAAAIEKEMREAVREAVPEAAKTEPVAPSRGISLPWAIAATIGLLATLLVVRRRRARS